VSEFLSSLSPGWWSVELPGVRPHPENVATYSRFATDLLPIRPSAAGDDFAWLSETRLHDDSTMSAASESARQDLSTEWLNDVLGAARVPHDLRRFVEVTTLRGHLRSATDCYFDLGDHVVNTAGRGRLVHLVSDSQWCRHWLLYTDDRGDEAVVTTEFPAGFLLGPDDLEAYSDEPAYEICAKNFAEFIWRFWIENEIWFALALDDHELTPPEIEYMDHYRRIQSTSD
jgi:hypothetical protein